MISLFLSSHPTFIREVVSIGKKVSEASLQIVPKYLSQTWRARSNYCCQPPFKVLLTQVANQLKSSPHTPLYQSDRDKAFSCPSDEDNQDFNDFIDFKLYTFADSSLRATVHFTALLKKSLGICSPACCAPFSYFLSSEFFFPTLPREWREGCQRECEPDRYGGGSITVNE